MNDELYHAITQKETRMSESTFSRPEKSIPGVLHSESWCGRCGRGFYALAQDDGTACPFCRARELELVLDEFCSVLQKSPATMRDALAALGAEETPPALERRLAAEANAVEYVLERSRSARR